MARGTKVFCIGGSFFETKPFGKLDAELAAPPSKAHTLRALFISALAEGKSTLKNPLLAEDQMHAINALREFGAKIETKGNTVEVQGIGGNLFLPSKEIFVGNSGVTARLLPTFASLAPSGRIVIAGDERMQSGRPIQDLLNALGPLGIKAKSVNGNGCLPIAVEGGSFNGGKTSLRGDISSQYFTSILMFAPYAKKDVEIETVGEMRSKPYIGITIQLMREFGVEAKNENYERFLVKAGQRYKAMEYAVEGDYSNASYFFAAAAILHGKVKVSNLRSDSAQGDKFFLDCLEKMGCKVKKGKDFVEVRGAPLKGISVDMNNCPDIVLTLAVVAAFADGTTKITNIEHLKYKECDRLNCTASELSKLGAKVEATEDSLIIKGNPDKLHGAEIETYNDHRMAMSFAVAGLKIKGVKIRGPDCVKKSFPDFFERLQALGG